MFVCLLACFVSLQCVRGCQLAAVAAVQAPKTAANAAGAQQFAFIAAGSAAGTAAGSAARAHSGLSWRLAYHVKHGFSCTLLPGHNHGPDKGAWLRFELWSRCIYAPHSTCCHFELPLSLMLLLYQLCVHRQGSWGTGSRFGFQCCHHGLTVTTMMLCS